jgi:hypothetical protein
VYRGCIHDGGDAMRGSNDMNREQQEKNTRFFYKALAVLGLLVVTAQVFIYVGYMIGEWLL